MKNNTVEIVNGRRITGYSWGWTLVYEHVRLANFPGQPLVVWRKFESLEAARNAANELGPLTEVDESKYAPKSP